MYKWGIKKEWRNVMVFRFLLTKRFEKHTVGLHVIVMTGRVIATKLKGRPVATLVLAEYKTVK